jgi:acetoin utilization protein AcuB
MTENPFCATPEDLLDAVAAAMQRGRFRHVPVVASDRRVLGVVSDRDLREQKGYWSSTKVSAVLSEPAVAVRPEDPIEDAAQTMLERKIGALPVVDREQRVVGIVTTTDLLRAMLDSIGGAEAVRIDLGLAGDRTGLADAVRTIEGAGGTVLSVGTGAVGEDSPRRFYVRVPAAGAARALGALQAGGFAATAERVQATAPKER